MIEVAVYDSKPHDRDYLSRALRCAGHNNVDLVAARDIGIAVARVPAYSPHAVAEHAVGLLLALNRKIHRAYNRVRELNFSLNGQAFLTHEALSEIACVTTNILALETSQPFLKGTEL